MKIMQHRYGGAKEVSVEEAFRKIEPPRLCKLLVILAKKGVFTADELEQLIDGDCWIEE